MASPSPAKSLKVWLIVILGIAAVCVVAMVLLYGQRQTGGMVQITQNGTVVGTYPLDQDTTLRVDSDNGGYNLVVIENPTVRVAEASCPDQVCVRHGATDQTADPIACLPNGLAMFPFVKEMRPRDKVVCMAFLACGGYSLGDFLAFNVNFQPNLLVPVFVGQICGGIIGILIGTGGSLLVGRLMFQMTIYPAAWITLCAFTLSVALGILFGIYPAAKAARLQPVEALRAE